MKKIIQSVSLSVMGLALPLVGLATVQVPTESPIKTTAQVEQLISLIAGWAQALFFLIAVIFIIIAAFRYLMSGGDATKTKEAQTMLVYAIVAAGVAVVAAGITALIKNFLGNITP